MKSRNRACSNHLRMDLQSGCIRQATKLSDKTAATNVQTGARQSRRCRITKIYDDSDRDASNYYNNNNNKSSSNSSVKIIGQFRGFGLMIITMTLATMLQQPQAISAAAISPAAVHQLDPLYAYTNTDIATDTSTDINTANHTESDMNTGSNTNSNSSLSESSTSSVHDNLPRGQTRLRKRSIDDYRYFHEKLHPSAISLEWLHPCGSPYDPSSMIGERSPLKFYLQQLRKAISREYASRRQLRAIDTSHMRSWDKHFKFYKFLPSIRQKSSKIALKRWYREMQVYVGSFAYLKKAQRHWDLQRSNTESDKTKELNSLFTSARSILCDIESTIIGSYSHSQKLHIMGRDEMDAKLQFRTRPPGKSALMEPSPIDLRFTKHNYFQFLTKMRKALSAGKKRKQSSSSTQENLSGNLLMQSSSESASAGESFEMQLDNSSSSAADDGGHSSGRSSGRTPHIKRKHAANQ